nr:DUF1702 family protein [Amycolatopsis rubida]
MSWLAVDGYGFDTERWVDAQEVPVPYPWQGRPENVPKLSVRLTRVFFFQDDAGAVAAEAAFDPVEVQAGQNGVVG